MASVQIPSPVTKAEDIRRNQKVLAVQDKIAQRASERGVLLVRVKDLPSCEGGTGMLTERQKQWLNTTTYDAKTQNPVLYRRTVELSKPARDAREREEACLEVQNLADSVTSAPPSGVAARIQEGRKERHEQTVDDMKQELAVISSELEPDIQTASELVKTQLADSDKAIETLFARIDNPELLQSLSLDELHSLWSEISSQSGYRQEFIHALDKTLRYLEERRHQMVLEVLKSYAHQLEVIAYLLPPDVHRLIEEEAHTVNMAIIANRRSYTQLCLHLMTADFARMKGHRQRWESAVAEWKDLICKVTLNQFISFMESGEVVSPPELERQRELLATEQVAVNRRREDLLRQMAGFRPPITTKSTVYQWKENVEKLNQQLECIHSTYLLQFQSSQEGVLRQCEHRMEQCREYLVSSGAFDADSVYKVMSQHFLPLVEQADQRMRAELQAVERSLDLVLNAQSVQFQSLYQYGQGAAHLWDTHLITIEEMERAFQEDLENCRRQHDVENQNLEANLDVVLDRLRQGASQEVLGQFLEEALKMLETIKEGYLSFHTCLSSESQKLPAVIQQELDSYDSSLCKYLGVDRASPKSKHSRSQLTRAPSEMLNVDSKLSSPKKSLRRPFRAKTIIGLNPKATRSPSHVQTTPEKRNLSAIVGEVISTSRGTSFYIHTTTSSEDQHGSGTFLTQDEESEGASLTFATENITILEQAFINAKNGFRLGFLEQLEQWRLEMISKAHETVAGKSEEANTELDLRLHLHEPRPSRIEQDLHHIRAAELESHRDRVSRHSQGLMASVNEQKTSTQKLAAQQELESEKFATEVMILESRLDSADKANKLSKIQDEAKHLLEKHLQHISLMSGSHRSHCEQALADLEDSNQSYKASLKLFSEGGNYCPEEVEQYSKRLNKLNSKIASARTFIGNEVSAMTNSHSEAAWEVMKQFEASYLLHSADLSFLEALSQTLTSAQVGIKSEVACSNGQARDIFQNIDKISATIKKVQAKEVPSSTLLAELSEFFTSLTRRADYLFCHSGGVRGARVGSHPEVAPSPSLVKSSGTPISAVNVTKSILEQTTARKRSGSSSDRDTGSRQSKAGVPATATHLEPQDRKGVVPASPSGMLLPDTQKKLGRQSISSHKRALAMERKHASFGIGGGEDGTDCFLPRIRAVLKTTHQALYSKADSYYKHKGTRPPTRPNEIQDTFEACIDSLITKCQLYRVQAEEYRNDCIEEFHGQLESAVAVLESVPGVVFGEVREEFQILLDKERTTRKEKYESTMRELRNTKECHEKCLRPGLGHPSQREQLENLCSKEEERHKASIKTTNQHTSAAKIGERQHTVKYILKLLESTKSLLTLFDSLTSSSDIIPGSDRHKSKPPVEKLLRLHVNQQLGSSAEHEEDTVAELTSASFTPSKLSGKMSGYVWSNLPESERKAIIDMLPPPTTISKKASGSNIARSTTSRKKMNASRLADRNASTEPPSSVNIGAGGRVGSGRRVSLLKQAPQSEETVLANMLVEKLVSSKWTSLHEAVIKTRDGAIQEYMKDYRDSTADTERQEEGVISVEEKWYRNWISSVDKIRQLYS